MYERGVRAPPSSPVVLFCVRDAASSGVDALRGGGAEAMHFELSDELKALVQVAREFAAERIVPFVEEWDKTHYFPYKEVIKPMAELGF
ncbi:MAG TPA: acyl-CoA dehydrogenase family protein, partial [Methylomirabilota bacterium]|nr:acyl-CoA dehydrogenase family protein [Methylomirabilota bacterium]